MNDNRKLFIVEFGKPDVGNFISYGGNNPLPAYVIANSYDEAAKKAMIDAEKKIEIRNIINTDGDINLNNEELMIKSVKLACNEIIW